MPRTYCECYLLLYFSLTWRVLIAYPRKDCKQEYPFPMGKIRHRALLTTPDKRVSGSARQRCESGETPSDRRDASHSLASGGRIPPIKLLTDSPFAQGSTPQVSEK